MASSSQPFVPPAVCPAQALTAQAQKEAHSGVKMDVLGHFLLKSSNSFTKMNPMLMVEMMVLILYNYLQNFTTEILQQEGPLCSTPPQKKKKKDDQAIMPSCVFAWQPKHTVGSPQPWKFVDSQFLHSVCFWHLERRNNNYYEAQMSEKGHLLCTNWWMGLVQKVSISRRNEKPISVSFSSEIDRISSTRPKHHKNPTVGRSCAHHWTGPKKKKSTEKPLPSKVLLSLQPVPCFS